MKSFKNFQEDVESLKKDLNDLERQTASSEKLATRRSAAKERIKSMASQFAQNVARKKEEDEERKERLAQEYEEKRKKKDS
jgi:hypothetical protein